METKTPEESAKDLTARKAELIISYIVDAILVFVAILSLVNGWVPFVTYLCVTGIAIIQTTVDIIDLHKVIRECNAQFKVSK